MEGENRRPSLIHNRDAEPIGVFAINDQGRDCNWSSKGAGRVLGENCGKGGRKRGGIAPVTLYTAPWTPVALQRTASVAEQWQSRGGGGDCTSLFAGE